MVKQFVVRASIVVVAVRVAIAVPMPVAVTRLGTGRLVIPFSTVFLSAFACVRRRRGLGCLRRHDRR
jgi:hypothetical protein